MTIAALIQLFFDNSEDNNNKSKKILFVDKENGKGKNVLEIGILTGVY